MSCWKYTLGILEQAHQPVYCCTLPHPTVVARYLVGFLLCQDWRPILLIQSKLNSRLANSLWFVEALALLQIVYLAIECMPSSPWIYCMWQVFNPHLQWILNIKYSIESHWPVDKFTQPPIHAYAQNVHHTSCINSHTLRVTVLILL